MATRSTITVKTKKGTYKTVYCHWDGYPEHVGKILMEYYSKYKTAIQLVNLGDISSLGRHIKPTSKSFHNRFDFDSGKYVRTNKPHTFDSKHENVTCFYIRDRQEKDCKTREYKTYTSEDSWQCYEYLLENGQWFVKGYETEEKFMLVSEILKL